MAITATKTTNITAYGSGQILPTYEIVQTFAAAIMELLPQYAFSTGFNALSVPTGATRMVVQNITGTLTLKGLTGDTGVPFSGILDISVTGGSTIGITASAGAKADILFI